jgi:hypothetical protein
MSEVENFEAEYRLLATKIIYAAFTDESDPEDQAELERRAAQLARLNSADFARGRVADESVDA